MIFLSSVFLVTWTDKSSRINELLPLFKLINILFKALLIRQTHRIANFSNSFNCYLDVFYYNCNRRSPNNSSYWLLLVLYYEVKCHKQLLGYPQPASPLGEGCSINRLQLCRGVWPPHTHTPPSVRYMTLKIWWWGSGNVAALRNIVYSFIANAPGCILAWNGSTW